MNSAIRQRSSEGSNPGAGHSFKGDCPKTWFAMTVDRNALGLRQSLSHKRVKASGASFPKISTGISSS